MFYVDDFLWAVFVYVAGWVGLLSCLTYGIMQLFQLLCRPQNLRAKYNAEWALVTGASSGIGKAITIGLAEQGVNVVLVALDDQDLSNTVNELRKRFPNRTFRAVGVNLGRPGEYMPSIVDNTKDVEINLLFNNAGYLVPGLFGDTDIEKLKMNFECNAVSAISITHHFLRLMQARRAKGLITFTSSAGAYLLGPTATMYSSSKAFLTNFAVTLAAEVRDIGIDVVAVHPSPINSKFYEKTAAALTSLQQARKAASEPEVIAEALFRAAGRIVVWEQGSFCAGIRLLNKAIDFAFFSELASRFAWLSGDHQALRKKAQKQA